MAVTAWIGGQKVDLPDGIAPPGYTFLTDHDGVPLTDHDGIYLMEKL